MSAGASTLTTYPHTPPTFALLGTETASLDSPADLDGARQRLSVLSAGNAAEWITLLREAGVRAHRRGSPDLLGQLAAAVRRPVDTVVLNLLDAEPATCLNAATAANFPDEVAAGAQVVARLGGATKWLLATDSRVPAAWRKRFAAAQTDFPSQPIALVNSYPQSDPTLLAYTLLNRKLRPGRLPTETGAIVLDAVAAFAVGRYALTRASHLRWPVCVRDHARRQTYFTLAPTGATIAEVLTQVGLAGTVASMRRTPAPAGNPTTLRGGDLLRDEAIDLAQTLGDGELVLHVSPPAPPVNPHACIRCGWCIDACPTRVQPVMLLEAAQRNDPAMADRGGIEACIECGVCAYVCPSELPLLTAIRSLGAPQSLSAKREPRTK